jgi:hypothetical protein
MNGPKEPQSTSPIVSEIRAHVVYDRKTGKVLHVHETVTFPNGPSPGESAEARALRLSGAAGRPDVEVVEVAPAAVKGHHGIRINPETRSIERLDAPGG